MPYIPQDRPRIHVIYILINELPLEVMQFMPPTTLKMTLDDDDYCPLSPIADDDGSHPLMPVDDIGVRGPVHHGDLFMLEEPIPAPLVQGIPPQEEDAEMDPTDYLVDLEENMKKPLLIIIANDEEEDLEEILIDDGDDEDADSVVFSDISSE